MTNSKLISFGATTDLYTFPETQDALNTNFGNVVTSTVRSIALSGGFDNYGVDPAPSEIGKIDVSFTLVARDPTDMTAKRDAVLHMADIGLQKLFMRPTNYPTKEYRWAMARVNNIVMPIRNAEHTDLFQPVQMTFQVPDPFWYSQGTESWLWGDGTKWGQRPWGSSLTPQAISGLLTEFTVTPIGTAPTRARILFTCGAAQTIHNPILQRVVNENILDQIQWIGTLVAGDSLEINARSWSIFKNNVDAYSSTFTFVHPDWFRLEPGANTIRARLGNSGDAGKVLVRYFDAYR